MCHCDVMKTGRWTPNRAMQRCSRIDPATAHTRWPHQTCKCPLALISRVVEMMFLKIAAGDAFAPAAGPNGALAAPRRPRPQTDVQATGCVSRQRTQNTPTQRSCSTVNQQGQCHCARWSSGRGEETRGSAPTQLRPHRAAARGFLVSRWVQQWTQRRAINMRALVRVGHSSATLWHI